MHWGDFGWGWGMGFGWLFMIAFWLLVILGIVYLIKLATGSTGKEKKEDTALDILEKRYAGGEITKEKFEKMRDDLTKR